MPQHAAVKLFQCPVHSDTVSHLFICLFFLAGFLELSISPLSFARLLIIPSSGADVRIGCQRVCGAEQHIADLENTSVGTPGSRMHYRQS